MSTESEQPNKSYVEVVKPFADEYRRYEKETATKQRQRYTEQLRALDIPNTVLLRVNLMLLVENVTEEIGVSLTTEQLLALLALARAELRQYERPSLNDIAICNEVIAIILKPILDGLNKPGATNGGQSQLQRDVKIAFIAKEIELLTAAIT